MRLRRGPAWRHLGQGRPGESSATPAAEATGRRTGPLAGQRPADLPETMSRAERAADALLLAGTVVTGPISRRAVRVLPEEERRVLPGDRLVTDAKVQWSHATTISAAPEEVWPWLVQMGCGRAGWYSYDGLDNGGLRSARRITAALQDVRVGDVLPMRPGETRTFVVRDVERPRSLVVADATGTMSWAFVTEPCGGNRSRLITRVRATYGRRAVGLLVRALLRPIHFAMVRRQLLTVKRLVETTTGRSPTS